MAVIVEANERLGHLRAASFMAVLAADDPGAAEGGLADGPAGTVQAAEGFV
jgi:hypothetical protein